jgi:hypothetical protein
MDFWETLLLMRFYNKMRPPTRPPGFFNKLCIIHTLIDDAELQFFHTNEGIFYDTWEAYMAKKSDWNLVSCKLTPEQGEEFTKWAEKHAVTGLSAAQELTALGYKVSFSWIDNSNAFCVSVTGKEDHKINPQNTVTSWSDDLFEAIAMNLYKVAVIYDGGKWEDTGAPSNWG